MPLIRCRVVCTLGETMASFSPISALSNVLFPAFGLPNMFTNPTFIQQLSIGSRTRTSGCQEPEVISAQVLPQKNKSLPGRLSWLRREGSNLRPSGYEPDELPLLYFAMWRAKVGGKLVKIKKGSFFRNTARAACFHFFDHPIAPVVNI